MQLKDTRLKHLRASMADQYTIQTVRAVTTAEKKSISLDVNEILKTESETALIYKALVTGLRDYIRKNGFAKVVIGLSGGIDSALTAAVAVDALGSENVYGILMPSHFSSESSLADAKALAVNLEIEHHTIPIKAAYDQFTDSLAPLFKDLPFNTAEENLQARIRGILLMGLSNKFGWIVIATGNKSEMSVGYSTLYGDLVGGFALLKDVFKTTVYELSKYRNTLSPVIPENSITKPPSAELRPGQKDQDELPPYDILDFIIKAYVEEDYSQEDIVYMGIDKTVVNKVTRLIDMNEYKRRQAPIGVKITDKAFGKDRRMPLTNLYKK
jgi:NAD+ synthase (glutamine-hydrolysing)